MEKQTQNENEYDDFSSRGDETTGFLSQSHVTETARRKGMTYMLLGNLFVFIMSTLTLICAVYSQRSQSTYSAARLMDEFGVYCMSASLLKPTIANINSPCYAHG